MATINSLEKDKRNALKRLEPNEMKVYIKTLVNELYDGFIEQNEDKALHSMKLIEEATNSYIQEGYENSQCVEVGLRLDKANELLCTLLEEKQELKVELSRRLVDEYRNNIIESLMYTNTILEKLLISWEVDPTGKLGSTIDDLLLYMTNHNFGAKLFLENHNIDDDIDSESCEIIRDEFLKFNELKDRVELLKS